MGLGRFRHVHRRDRERSNLSCRERSEGPVEDLTSGYCNGSRGHQTCTDGCYEPTSDQEESLPQ